MNLESQYKPKDLLSYRGVCKLCGSERRIHSFDCSKKKKEELLNESRFKSTPAVCFSCSIEKKTTVKTVKWTHKLSKQQALKDLQVLSKGVKIDHDKAERGAAAESKLSREADEMVNRGQDALSWAKQKALGKNSFYST